MRKTIVAALAAALMSSGAYAADAFDKGSTKDAGVFSAPAVVNWSGIYIGGGIGWGNSNHELALKRYNGSYCFDRGGDALLPHDPTDATNPFGDAPYNTHIDNVPTSGDCNDVENGSLVGQDISGLPVEHNEAGPDHAAVDPASRELARIDGVNASGLVGDVRLGADVARGRFLFGLLGGYGFSQMEATASVADFGSASIEKGDEWYIGARAGLIVAPRTLLYVMAAYVETDYDFSVSDGTNRASRNVDFSGVKAGAGVEFALTNNVRLAIEGTHDFLGEETIFDTGGTEVGGFGHKITDEIGETKIMGRLNITTGGVIPGLD